jgi:hypothetical protein
MSKLSDQQITCGDCGKEYVWIGEEQAFFAARGFPPPKRCKQCRESRKEQRAEATANWGRKVDESGSS